MRIIGNNYLQGAFSPLGHYHTAGEKRFAHAATILFGRCGHKNYPRVCGLAIHVHALQSKFRIYRVEFAVISEGRLSNGPPLGDTTARHPSGHAVSVRKLLLDRHDCARAAYLLRITIRNGQRQYASCGHLLSL